MYIALEVIEWVMAAFVRDHNVLYMAATAIEYMIYLLCLSVLLPWTGGDR